MSRCARSRMVPSEELNRTVIRSNAKKLRPSVRRAEATWTGIGLASFQFLVTRTCTLRNEVLPEASVQATRMV